MKTSATRILNERTLRFSLLCTKLQTFLGKTRLSNSDELNLTQSRKTIHRLAILGHALATRLRKNCRCEAKLQLTVLNTFSNLRLFCVVLSTLLMSCQMKRNPLFRVNSTIAEAPQTQSLGFANSYGTVQAVFLSDGLIWLEYGASTVSSLDRGIPTSAMIETRFKPVSDGILFSEDRESKTLRSQKMSVTLDKKNLCLKIFENETEKMISVCPKSLGEDLKALHFTASDVQSVFGLGQYFRNPQTSDGSLLGQTITPGPFGNELRGFSGGANSTAQFPTFTVQQTKGTSYFSILDNVYRQSWNFGTLSATKEAEWNVSTYGENLRLFLGSPGAPGQTRSAMMKLLGTPIVPPRKMFGLWLSEFGFDSWQEMETKEQSLRNSQFPMDGMVMDLQWFGGEFFGTRHRMGTLQFDQIHFPNPKEKIAEFKSRGLGLMTVEESYVDEETPEHTELGSKGYLVRACEGCLPARLTKNPWWGIGGMLDWTQKAAGQFWHTLKRNPLVEMGIIGHWTDLGEPEMYDPNGRYQGDLLGADGSQSQSYAQADVHNLYSYLWAKSIAEGYQLHQTKQRPFVLTRSGTLGIQQFGAAMWSGDIGANLGALKAQFNAQSQMFHSGIDFYGSDAGGFHRYSLDGDLNSLFTQWFAQSALLDVPVRPHAWNTDNSNETSPAKIGHLESNKANIELRYQLFPYYYSLAHGLSEGKATSLIAPPSFYYPADPTLAEMGHEKMIGPFLLTGLIADYDGFQRSFYFPDDDWFDFRSGELVSSRTQKSSGRWVSQVSTISDKGLFSLPLFARDGAIVPMSPLRSLDAQQAVPSDLLAENGLRLRIFPRTGHEQSQFSLLEDDGWSNAYAEKNESTSTQFIQKSVDSSIEELSWEQKINAPFIGQQEKLPILLEIANPHSRAKLAKVLWNEFELSKCDELTHWRDPDLKLKSIKSAPCYVQYPLDDDSHFFYVWLNNVERNGGNKVKFQWAKLPSKEVATSLKNLNKSVLFVCGNALTSPREAWYAIGNSAAMGSWNPAEAIKLEPALYPNWAKEVKGFRDQEVVEWKCLLKNESSGKVLSWQAESNNVFTVSDKVFQNIAVYRSTKP
jgi:alpha-glucosidase (family GH31 glycosyl hydrolase)